MVLKSSINKQLGFTLVEIMIVTVILSILVMLLSMLMSNSFKTYSFNRKGIEAQDSAAKALRDFENKSRSVEQLLTTEKNEFAFYAYIAGDQRPAPSKIRYYVQDSKLIREIYHPTGTGPNYTYLTAPDTTETIATGVINTNDIFSYYSGDNYSYNNDSATLLPFPISMALVKMVRITLEVDLDTTKAPEASHETTLVNLRNLKRNL